MASLIPSPLMPLTVFNGGTGISPLMLPNWRKAVAKVRAGNANGRVLVIGDSTTIGINAAGVAQWPSITDHLATQLTAASIQGNSNCFCGFSVPGASTGSRLGTDPRISAGSWTSGNRRWAAVF